MTGNECLAAALALMYCEAGESGEYAEGALPILNLLLAETFPGNNSLREYEGLEPLGSIPSMSSLDEDIPCQDRVARGVLPYGLAGLLLGEDDTVLSAQYKNKYEFERASVYCGAYADVTDRYAGEDM